MLRPRFLAALGVDLLLLVGFAALGRSSHDEGTPVGGTLLTAAPFVIGYSAGALATGLHRDPLSVSRAAVAWAPSIALALMLRRVVFDRGIAVPFMIVALATTAILLLGWRAAVHAARARSH